jgi:hypothetical protein
MSPVEVLFYILSLILKRQTNKALKSSCDSSLTLRLAGEARGSERESGVSCHIDHVRIFSSPHVSRGVVLLGTLDQYAIMGRQS